MLVGTGSRARLWLAALAVALLVLLLVSGWILHNRQSPPQIQGVLLTQARDLPAFQLTDHRAEPFRNEDLKGNWHLVTYGFTHCPDICPSMLAAMSSMVREMEREDSPYADVDLLFYSVDPARDTPAYLADYVTFFHSRFTGLTVNGDPEENAKAFERGLGIVYEIPVEDRFGNPFDENNYPVNHGVKIYLLNPEGRLQAVFDPAYSDQGMVHYSTRQLIQDYQAVRQYLAGS